MDDQANMRLPSRTDRPIPGTRQRQRLPAFGARGQGPRGAENGRRRRVSHFGLTPEPLALRCPRGKEPAMDTKPDQPSGADHPRSDSPPGPGPEYPGQPPVIVATGTGWPRVRPGRVWYLAALAVLLAGVAWIVFGLISVSRQVASFPRAPLPAGGTVTLDRSGGYVVYYEGPGASSGRIPAFNVRIAPAAPPAAVGSLRRYTASVNYSFGAHQGRAVL